MSTKYSVQAKYIEHVIKEHQGNPLIAALSDFLAHKKELQKLLTTLEKISEEELTLPGEHRKVIGQRRLSNFFKPLQIHLELFVIIIEMIFNGYLDRNPVAPIQHKAKYPWQQYDIIDPDPVILPKILALIGNSGIGKSAFINTIQRQFPPVIEHTEYKGKRMELIYQIPILKVQTISSGSTKSVCEAIIAEIDRLLGGDEQYFARTRRRSANTLIQDIKTYVRIHAVGLIVFDEFQNIQGLAVGRQEEVKNFILQLSNELKVPMIFIGTPKAKELIENELRIGRRMCQEDVYRWTRMKNDTEWSWFVRTLFGIQYVKNRIKPTQEIIDCLYDETQGIIALVVTLFRLAQERAIDQEIEIISISLIKSVARDTFVPIQSILTALKNKDVKVLKRYKDIDLMEMLEDKKKESIKTKIEKKNTNRKKKEGELVKLQDEAIKAGRLIYDVLEDTGNIANSDEFK